MKAPAALSARVERLEARRGLDHPQHVAVWLVRIDEANAEAEQRAWDAGYTSIGALLPDDVSEAAWVVLVEEHTRSLDREHARRRASKEGDPNEERG